MRQSGRFYFPSSEKVFPAPFPNDITKVMLLALRTIKFKQHYYMRSNAEEGGTKDKVVGAV